MTCVLFVTSSLWRYTLTIVAVQTNGNEERARSAAARKTSQEFV